MIYNHRERLNIPPKRRWGRNSSVSWFKRTLRCCRSKWLDPNSDLFVSDLWRTVFGRRIDVVQQLSVGSRTFGTIRPATHWDLGSPKMQIGDVFQRQVISRSRVGDISRQHGWRKTKSLLTPTFAPLRELSNVAYSYPGVSYRLYDMPKLWKKMDDFLWMSTARDALKLIYTETGPIRLSTHYRQWKPNKSCSRNPCFNNVCTFVVHRRTTKVHVILTGFWTPISQWDSSMSQHIDTPRGDVMDREYMDRLSKGQGRISINEF